MSKKREGRRQRSGIYTIKYHTRPRTPYGKVAKAQENVIHRSAYRSALTKHVTTRQCNRRQRQTQKKIHKRSQGKIHKKCHSMRVTRHQHHKQILFDYSLHNQTLENVQSAKYLGIPSLVIWIGVNTFQKFLPKQLRHSVSFAGIWLLHLGVLRKLHTKVWFGLNWSMQHPFGALTQNFRLIR